MFNVTPARVAVSGTELQIKASEVATIFTLPLLALLVFRSQARWGDVNRMIAITQRRMFSNSFTRLTTMLHSRGRVGFTTA